MLLPSLAQGLGQVHSSCLPQSVNNLHTGIHIHGVGNITVGSDLKCHPFFVATNFYIYTYAVINPTPRLLIKSPQLKPLFTITVVSIHLMLGQLDVHCKSAL